MKYLYLLLFSIVPAKVFSQTNFQKGYVIKSAGDTLHGYIDYKEWNRNPQKISFKANNLNQATQVLGPSDIYGFSVNGFEQYRSYQGKVSMSRTQGTNLSIDIDTSSDVVSTFLKLLVNAKPIMLYSYTDILKSRYFVQENDAAPIELKYDVYYKPNNAEYHETTVVKSDDYKRQLIVLAVKNSSSSQAVIDKVNTMHYSEADITNIIEVIDNKHAEKKAQNAGIRLFAGALVNYSKTKFAGNDAFSYAKPGNYTGPVFSLGADLFNNSHLQKFILRAELTLSWIKPSYYLTDYDYADSYAATIKQRNVTILPQAIYNFYNKENIKAYLGVGFGANFSSYNNVKTIVTGGNTIVTKNAYDFNTFWTKYTAEAGFVLNKRVEVFVRYFPPVSFSGSSAFTISTSEYQFGAHWLFGKRY
jgi:hypothetical protein